MSCHVMSRHVMVRLDMVRLGHVAKVVIRVTRFKLFIQINSSMLCVLIQGPYIVASSLFESCWAGLLAWSNFTNWNPIVNLDWSGERK